MKLNWKIMIMGTLLLLLPILFAGVHASAASSTQTLSITQPRLAPGQYQPLATVYHATVIVNVTSALPIANVTLYYIDLPSSRFVPPANLSLYSTVSMSFLNPFAGNLSEYRGVIPPQPNSTNVFGAARVVTSNGTSVTSPTVQLYYVEDYPPEVSLRLLVNIVDIDPKFLLANMSISGSLWDTIPNTNVFWTTSGGTFRSVPQLNQTSGYSWEFSTTHYIQLYSFTGDARLYPFDHYNYTIDLTLAPGFNLTSLTMNGKQVAFGKPLLFPISPGGGSFASYADVSQWNIQSQVLYMAPANKTSSSHLIIAFQFLNRTFDNIALSMIPVIAMFAILGGSVALRDKSDTTNRLAIYLTVIVFAFGFFTGIRTLGAVPSTIGLTMLERLAFALVPSTAVLTIVSIIRTRIKIHRGNIADTVGVFLCGTITYLETSFTSPYQGSSYSVLDFADLQFWGLSVLLALFLGLIINVLLRCWQHLKRYSISFARRLIQRSELPKGNHKSSTRIVQLLAL